jgi:DNA-binding transcriptional regulator LsrR (DeoR family)
MFSIDRLFCEAPTVALNGNLHRLLYKIAQSYYLDGLTQQEIADRFGLSRPKVSRLLHQGRENGVITVNLVPPPHGMAELEHVLEQKYGLEEAVVTMVRDPDDLPAVARELGPAAVQCLLRFIHGHEIVGFTWGTTMLSIVDALPSKFWPNVTIVQVMGGLGPVGEMEHSTELVQRAAQKLNARLRLLPAPGVVSSRDAAVTLNSDNQISDTLALAAKADIILVGLGVPSPDAILLRDGNIVTQEDLKKVMESGGVGDIALRYIDARGKPIDLEINERIIGLTLEQIVHIPRVIAVAGGKAKYRLIRAALRGKLLNVLVTDHETANALVAEED